MDFLSEILAVKRRRVATAKARLPLDKLRTFAHQIRAGAQRYAFRDALSSDSRINLIAEFKRRSPSKGRINSQADPAAMAQIYESAGAAAISVLTEHDYFDGSLEDLRRVRETTRLPILRKDFIFDDYQIYESAYAGADALLLIVAALDDPTLASLRTVAEDELGMDALIEVHTKNELDRAIACGARLIGVNNRDLRTFEVSVATSYMLARAAPKDAILVSESGLTLEEVRRLREDGYRGFLVGEALMRAADPAEAIRGFIGESEPLSPRSVFVKICGITNVEDARAAITAGANMLGFNFYAHSPRYIEPDAARQIIDTVRAEAGTGDNAVTMIGVFVNESVKNVRRIADEAGLDGLQLHGDETIEFCDQLKRLLPRQFVIKVVPTTRSVDVESLGRYPTDAFMLDAHDSKLRGGTGRIADWTIASKTAKVLPRLFLAGGLSPENVADAIAAVRPYAVDACSSLEMAPGRKDHARLREFVTAVRESKLHVETTAK